MDEPGRAAAPSGGCAACEELAALEPLFHRFPVAPTREQLEAMTDPDFWEVGASGTRYDRRFVIDTLLARHAADGGAASRREEGGWRSTGLRCRELGGGHYLLTYTLHQGGRVTRRSTLWRREAGGWKAVYHQGTVVGTPRP